MFDTFLFLLLAALLVQIAMTQNFLSHLRADAPGLFAQVGHPNAWFFMLHGGPGDRHPFLDFLKRRHFLELLSDFPMLRMRAGRLLLLYRVVSGMWIATFVSAAGQVVVRILG